MEGRRRKSVKGGPSGVGGEGGVCVGGGGWTT